MEGLQSDLRAFLGLEHMDSVVGVDTAAVARLTSGNTVLTVLE
jgi:hypothetical protein